MPASAPNSMVQRLSIELGLSPTETANEFSDAEWKQINLAVGIVLTRMRAEVEVRMHLNGLLPCDALLHAGIVNRHQLAGDIASGLFDAQLCSLPLREL